MMRPETFLAHFERALDAAKVLAEAPIAELRETVILTPAHQNDGDLLRMLDGLGRVRAAVLDFLSGEIDAARQANAPSDPARTVAGQEADK